MGRKKRIQVKAKQKMKRHENRLKIKAKGLNPDNFYVDGIYTGNVGK